MRSQICTRDHRKKNLCVLAISKSTEVEIAQRLWPANSSHLTGRMLILASIKKATEKMRMRTRKKKQHQQLKIYSNIHVIRIVRTLVQSAINGSRFKIIHSIRKPCFGKQFSVLLPLLLLFLCCWCSYDISMIRLYERQNHDYDISTEGIASRECVIFGIHVCL